MAIPYEKIVEEDLNLGTGTVDVTMPGGGSSTGHRVHIGSFADTGQTTAQIGAASAHPGQLRVVSDSTTTTPGATLVGGGANRVLVFSNGTTWKVVMG